MLVHHSITPSNKLAGTNSYTWVETGTVSVLPKNTTQCSWPQLEPGPHNPETSALMMRLLRLVRGIPQPGSPRDALPFTAQE